MESVAAAEAASATDTGRIHGIEPAVEVHMAAIVLWELTNPGIVNHVQAAAVRLVVPARGAERAPPIGRERLAVGIHIEHVAAHAIPDAERLVGARGAI